MIKRLWERFKSWVNRVRASEPPQLMRYAPPWMAFVKRGRGHFLVSTGRSHGEIVRKLLEKELRRLGWPTRNLKVHTRQVQLKGGNEPRFVTKFFVDLGPYRGLEPNLLYSILKSLPTNAGAKEILRRASKLEECVECVA